MSNPDKSGHSRPAILWAGDLTRSACNESRWLWHGYLAAGQVTLLTSQWKAGKTTLLSVLLQRLERGGELAERAVRAGKAAVLTEESVELWAGRSRKFRYGNHVCWCCRPFRARPTAGQWLALLDQLAELHRQVTLDLLVLDPLATFVPGAGENTSRGVLDFLTPLQRLTAAGVAVLLLHHPRKFAQVPGQTARGSGALPGYADVVLEMTWLGSAASDDRRRKLLGWSRFEETPRELVVELNADGTDYAALGTAVDASAGDGRAALFELLAAAPEKLSRQEILDAWPRHRPAPDAATLWRWLDGAVADGTVRRDGPGHKSAPFRYWLPAAEERWRSDPTRRLELDGAEAWQRLYDRLRE